VSEKSVLDAAPFETSCHAGLLRDAAPYMALK